MKKIIVLVVLMLALVVTLCGCRQADRVSHNIGVQADNFNITRRLAVINARTDTPMFELVGNFSLKNNSTSELEVICEVAPNVYKKHFIYLNEWTLYVVEDVSGANVSSYHYEVNFLPQTFRTYSLIMTD